MYIFGYTLRTKYRLYFNFTNFSPHFWRLKTFKTTSVSSIQFLNFAFWRNFANKKKARLELHSALEHFHSAAAFQLDLLDCHVSQNLNSAIDFHIPDSLVFELINLLRHPSISQNQPSNKFSESINFRIYLHQANL